MIKIERKESTTYEGGWSYIRLGGELRANIKRIAAWAGKTSQDVGEDLLKQAVAEVLPKIPKDFQAREKPMREYARNKRRS